MDNKQIEEVVGRTKELLEDKDGLLIAIIECNEERAAKDLQTLLSLAQLFLSVSKEMPKKKEQVAKTFNGTHICSFNEGYNLCHDEFTAWLVGLNIRSIIEKCSIEHEKIHESTECGMCQEGKNNLATAIKTMILGEE